jgi:hypothetical protein
MTERSDLRLAAVFCGMVGLYELLWVAFTLTRGPVIGPVIDVLFPDFLVFHAAARAWVEGKLALVYDIDAFMNLQLAAYPDRLEPSIRFRPFFYPPVFLLLLLPLGAFAVAKAYALFMAATAAVATLLEGRHDPWGWLAIMVSPAAAEVVISGQNTFLSLALLYGGMRLLDRSPMAAGLLLGVLSFKPQLFVLVPVALVAARQWRALGWMVASVAALSLASLALFGIDFWLAFVDATRTAASPQVVDEMYQRIYMHMTTLLAAARLVGLPPALAGALQVAGAVLAVGAVWHAFRHFPSGAARTAVLATATFLVSPYTLNYDLLLLMPSVVALFRLGVAQGFHPGERLVHIALWLMPSMGLLLNRNGLPLMPLVILLFGTIAFLRLRNAAKVELPRPAGAG